MAKLPQLQNITADMLPDQLRAQLDTLVRQLNQFVTPVHQGLDQGLTFSDNFSAQIQSVQFTAPKDWVTVSSFANSWAALGGGNQVPRYLKDSSGYLVLGGALTGGSSNTPAFTVGSQYAPDATSQVACFNWNGSAPVSAGIKVDTSGNVIPVCNSNAQVWLDGVRIPCADRTPIPLAPFPLTYRSTLKAAAAGLWLISATITDPVNKGIPDPTKPVPPLFVDWVETSEAASNGQQGGRVIKIRSVYGGVPGTSYRLTLLTTTG